LGSASCRRIHSGSRAKRGSRKQRLTRARALRKLRRHFHPARPRKRQSALGADAFEMMGEMTGKAIRDAIAPLEARIAELEASPKYVSIWTAGTKYPARFMASWGAASARKQGPPARYRCRVDASC
jgi:hypothetical protein